MTELEAAAMAQCKAGVATQGLDPDQYRWQATTLPDGSGVHVKCWRIDWPTSTGMAWEGVLPLSAIALHERGSDG